MNIIKKIITIILFSFIIFFIFSYIHELTHAQIGSYYGCKSEIHLDFLNPENYINNKYGLNFMSTRFTNDCKMTESQILAQSINEIVGYNIMVILQLFLIIYLITNSNYFSEENKKQIIEIKEKKKSK